MVFRCVYWLILAFICDNHAVFVKGQTQPGGLFHQRLTLEELLEPSEINFFTANPPGGQVTNPSVSMNAVIFDNLDTAMLGTLDLSMLERTIANMQRTGRLGPRQILGMEDPMEPAELGEGGMVILSADGRSRTQKTGSLINILRILQGQQSIRSSTNQQTLAAGSGSEQTASGQAGVRNFQTRPREASPKTESTNSRIILSRLPELLNRLPPGFENLKQLDQQRQRLPGDSHTRSKNQQTGLFNRQGSSADQYNPQAGPGRWQSNTQSTDPFLRQSSQQERLTDPMNGSQWSQSERSDQQTWSGNSNRLPSSGVTWPDNSETWQSNTEGLDQMGSSYSGIPNYPQKGSEYIKFGGNSPRPGSVSRQREPNYSQDQFNNQAANQIYDNGAQGNNGNSQSRAPVNAPPATSEPATFVDNRPDLNLKGRVSVGNQQELIPGQQLVTSNSQTRPGGWQPGLLNTPSGTTDSSLGSTNSQSSNQQNEPTNTHVSLNNLQAVLGETLTVEDNPPPVPSNTADVTDPFVSSTDHMAGINPSDPSAPGAPANAPLDVPPEWTTPGLITPVPGKSSLLVIPGPLLGKKVYPNS